MPRGIIKIKDKYFEWSAVTDSPVTFGMNELELRAYIKSEYGNSGIKNLDKRIEACKERGTSFIGQDLNSITAGNRAGKLECELTIEEIYNFYMSYKSFKNSGI